MQTPDPLGGGRRAVDPDSPTSSPIVTPTPPEVEQEISEEGLSRSDVGLTRVSDPPERQATDVKPMRYVLTAGIAGAVIGMLIAYFWMTAGVPR